MKKTLLLKLAILLLITSTMSGCLLIPVDDGNRRGGIHERDHGGDRHGDRDRDRGGPR